MNRDDEVKQALAQVARLGGFQIKRVATTDDLKDKTLTITLTRVSDGWVQDRLNFEDEGPGLVASVNGRGEVEKLDPSDLTEKDETIADPDEGAGDEGVEAVTEPTESPRLSEPEEAIKPHLVGELAAAARKRR
jgi:hypothetical protein